MREKMKKRIFELDFLRTIACMMVIAMHAPMSGENANGIFLSSLSYFTAPCIGLFFMISGALLLPTKETDSISFIKKRLTKIVCPTLAWTLFYIITNTIKGEGTETLIKQLTSIAFSPQGNGVMWFMYTLIGLYIIAPIISRWLERCSKREIELYLVLWGVTLCYPILETMLYINRSDTGILYYCSGYAGYMLLGYYMKQYPTAINGKVLIPLCSVSVAAPIVCKICNIEIDFYTLFWYLSIFVVIMCAAWFKMAMEYGNKIVKSNIGRSFIENFSNVSFGIYFIHIFVLRCFLWEMKWIKSIDSYILQTVILATCTIAISYATCYIISLLPKAEYIIGYKKK